MKMEEWKECKLGEIAHFTTGKLNSNAAEDNGLYPFFTCSPETYRINSYAFDTNAILLAGNNAEGNFNIKRYSGKFNAYQRTYVITVDDNTDLNFLFYALKLCLADFKHISQGTATKFLTAQILNNFVIRLPPLPTQQKIAAILSSLDDKIELNNKINTNLEQQAQALFDEMFKDYEKDILLGDVIETTSGGTPSRKNMAFYTNGNNCWVKSKELESGFIIDTEEKITDDAINNSAAKLLPKNSVLIAMYGATVGAYGIISKPMTCNQAICALLPNENYPYTYLFMFAKNVTQELENLAIGSAQQNISQVLIKKLKVHSDTNKIKEFHSSTHALFEQMLLIRQENKTLSELRDSLLPKLMNGEIEVGIK